VVEFAAEVPHTSAAPRVARRALTEWIGDTLDDDDLAKATLMVSELVTNAVVHGYGSITLRGELNEARLLVEVIDQGDGFEHTVRKHHFDSIGGRGLTIVDADASRWGIHEGTTHVWFELERPGPRLGTAEKPASQADQAAGPA